MLSPTYYEVRKAEIYKKLDQARTDKNLAVMQGALRELTALNNAYYGTAEQEIRKATA